MNIFELVFLKTQGPKAVGGAGLLGVVSIGILLYLSLSFSLLIDVVLIVVDPFV